MTNPETVQYSSIRAIRPVIQSESLAVFMGSAAKLVAEWGFDHKKGYAVEPLVFAAEKLHLTLFKRRAQTSYKVNDALRKIEVYLQDDHHSLVRSKQSRPGVRSSRTIVRKENLLPRALLEVEENYVPGAQPLRFSASNIIRSTADESGHTGYELALVVDEGPVAMILDAQSGLINDAALRTNASRQIAIQGATDSPRELAFMRAPFRSSADRNEFIEALSTEAPVYDVGLESLEYLHRLPIPRQ